MNNTNGRYTHLLLWYILLLACIQFAFQVGLLFKGIEFIQSALIHDDTYYYLQPAWNLKEFGFVTFDGLHKTNGVQMLWFWVVAGLALLSSSKIVLLYAALAITFLFNAACYAAIWKIGTLTKYPIGAVFLGSFWFLQVVSPNRVYTMGMENSLHALIFWCVVWQCFQFLLSIRERTPLNWIGFTSVLILNVWVRLDSAVFSGILYIFCVGLLAYHAQSLPAFFKKYGKPVSTSALSAVAGAGLLFLAFWLMGNSYVPISGIIKSEGFSWGWDPSYNSRLVKALTASTPHVLDVLVPRPLVSRFVFYAVAGIGLSTLTGLSILNINRPSIKTQTVQKLWNSVLTLFFLICMMSRAGQYNPVAAYMGFGISISLLAWSVRPRTTEFAVFQWMWYSLFVAFFAYHGMLTLMRVSYFNHYTWYRSPLYIFWLMTCVFMLSVFTRLVGAGTWNRILQGFIVGCSVVYLILSSYYHFAMGSERKDSFRIRYQAALWMDEHIPPNTICAAWNAGQLGYFSNRQVINLDGLMNSIDYYENITSSTSLLDYLHENNVEYLVDYCCVEELLPHLQLVHNFPPHSIKWWEEPIQVERIQVWQLSPQE